MTKKEIEKIENKAITICIFFVFIMAASGVVFGFLAGSSAILLDGIFSTVLLVTVFLSKYVQKIITKKSTHDYPIGFNNLESLYIFFKIMILIGILLFSLLHSLETIFAFYFHSITPGTVDEFYAHIYYVVKIVAFVFAYVIYTNAIVKTDGKANLLKVERKGVLIDGGITFGIMIGMIILPLVGVPEVLADSIVLLLLSVFLLIVMYKDLKEELKLVVNKRIYLKEEEEYKKIFNDGMHICIINYMYIVKNAKQTYVYIEFDFKNSLEINELQNTELLIKELMYENFGDVIIFSSFSKQLV